eukprot:TRINITY_DN56068_c0_g1_i2.p1 TRINITY_DN56068_c0_g1~~TRINITY_DN56068_c0_g1_i2.p1  ORF type:complete len:211 (-),score=33.61 TRINITY_DN56068_c0_g1_i2:50-682(-)
MSGPPRPKDTCGRKCGISWLGCAAFPLLLILLLVAGPFYLAYRALRWCCLTCCCRRYPRADTHWDPSSLPTKAGRCCKVGLHGTRYYNLYIEADDCEKLAADIYLPEAAFTQGQKVPTVLHQARYCRSFMLRWPLSWFFPHSNVSLVANQFGHDLVKSGQMAFVSVDIRGTGASGGRFSSLWNRRERQDSLNVIESVSYTHLTLPTKRIV